MKKARRKAPTSTSAPKAPLTATQILSISENARDSFFRDIDANSIHKSVHDKMSTYFKSILWASVGCKKDTWDRWEFNDRAPGWNVLKQSVETAVKQWLADNASNIGMIMKAKEQSQKLLKEYERAYNVQLKSSIENLAEERAQSDAEAIIDAVALDGSKLREVAAKMMAENTQQKAAIADRVTLGKDFGQQPIINEVKVIGAVSIKPDGWLSDKIEDPDNPTWFLLKLTGDITAVDVVSNGEQWQPVSITVENDGVYLAESQILESFQQSDQLIFAYLGPADKTKIQTGIAKFCERATEEGRGLLPRRLHDGTQ